MAYAQIDVDALDHWKVLAISDTAFRLWIAIQAHCQKRLTDGFIDTRALPTLRAKSSQKIVDELVRVALLDKVEKGYQLHDYADWNKTREQVEHEQQRWRENKRNQRNRRRESPESPRDVPEDSPESPGVSPACPQYATQRNATHAQRGQGVPVVPSAEPYAETWRLLAASHGVDLCLGFDRTDADHLIALADAYNLEDFRLAARTWWDSPHTGGRNMGLFKKQIAEVLAHAKSGATYPFRGKAPLAAVEKSAPAYRKAADVFAGERL